MNADKSRASLALIMGDDEFKNNTLSVKFLREEKPQQQLAIDELRSFLQDQLFTG